MKIRFLACILLSLSSAFAYGRSIEDRLNEIDGIVSQRLTQANSDINEGASALVGVGMCSIFIPPLLPGILIAEACGKCDGPCHQIHDARKDKKSLGNVPHSLEKTRKLIGAAKYFVTKQGLERRHRDDRIQGKRISAFQTDAGLNIERETLSKLIVKFATEESTLFEEPNFSVRDFNPDYDFYETFTQAFLAALDCLQNSH